MGKYALDLRPMAKTSWRPNLEGRRLDMSLTAALTLDMNLIVARLVLQRCQLVRLWLLSYLECQVLVRMDELEGSTPLPEFSMLERFRIQKL